MNIHGYKIELIVGVTDWFRTVLVVWPERYHPEMVYRTDAAIALSTFDRDWSKKPHEMQNVAHYLVDFIEQLKNKSGELWGAFNNGRLIKSAPSPGQVAHSVCRAARAWRDLELWRRAAQTCQTTVRSVGIEELVECVTGFGFDEIRERCI